MHHDFPPPGRNRLVPPLVLLIGLALTLLTFQRIQTSDTDAARADREAGAAQLGLLLQSLASSIETDLTATVNVALVTGGDPETYRARAADGSDRALLELRPDLRVAATAAGPEGDRAAASIVEMVRSQGLEPQLSALAETGEFRFVLFDGPDGTRSLLLAAGASDDRHAFVEVRRFALDGAGPAVVELVDGIESFAVYASTRPDPDAAIMASTDDLPLAGPLATSTATVGHQQLLVEVTGSAVAAIPPLAVLGIGAVVSIALAGLLFVSQRRRDQAIDALAAARTANEARIRMQADLQQAQRMETVGQLAGGVAHDFNNLLAAITATVELVADDVDDPRTLEDLAEIRNAARRGAALTRRLLSFARRDVETRDVLDLNAVVEDIEPLLRRSVSEDVSLWVLLHPSAIPILGDAAEVEQILLNLVVNAREAGTGSDDRISVSTGVLDGRAVLQVRDEGVGMPPEVVAHAFEPFFSTRSTTGGTGLGLAIVYGIVLRMGGDVRIESQPGEGTTVTVALPIHEGPADAATGDEPASGSTGIPAGEDVLLVEDEATVRRATRRLLERAGHRVVEAGDGIAALGVVEDGYDPTVVLTDVVLPGSLNGRDLADQLVQLVPTARVVFTSGYPSEVIDQRQLLDEGARYLAKPFTSDALLSAVQGDEPAEVGR